MEMLRNYFIHYNCRPYYICQKIIRFFSGCILLLGYVMPDLSDLLLTLRMFLIFPHYKQGCIDDVYTYYSCVRISSYTIH